jgi:hypothetical protein
MVEEAPIPREASRQIDLATAAEVILSPHEQVFVLRPKARLELRWRERRAARSW